MPAEVALVAIGANLPREDGAGPHETCRWAVGRLGAIPGLRVVAVSSWWESAPIPPDPRSPPYVNGVARLEGEATPEGLLAALHAIEDEAGRARPFPNAPRVLDLDLIDLGGRVLAGPAPILPHPRAAERAFVLRPLAEVAPGWVHPVLGRPVEALIAALPPQEIGRLAGE
ncbi:2-amino-4-hydroxy-6-hydroxymethyldihydropteridine diphosphokinase [Roseomonas sp. PWR1]|uniref:2-amino-4-hydroxy-6-hydroxymethyldihydropteridine pyrophosphokinase n=1 Tax=Roseomonas nitratireducens TaxID=2820810 RepID=A0ABS4AWQ6_9PROT|nr:2-amino-4-hydroxy-6-hydroxymethyldihydropteridine diphosphokinase [Neoroseomonas nitratireducens]MBP0465811.1 2-amino-4-hydroxy-6-hydroxymethyldihydropteridine diphosphokinase [Neoroseomonas nitratireducens]